MSEKTIKNNEKVLEILTEKIERALKEIICNKLYYYTPIKRDYDGFSESDIDTTDLKKYVFNMLMEQIGKSEMEEKIRYGDDFMMYESGICELDLESEPEAEKESEKPKPNLLMIGMTATMAGFGAFKLLRYLREDRKENLLLKCFKNYINKETEWN